MVAVFLYVVLILLATLEYYVVQTLIGVVVIIMQVHVSPRPTRLLCAYLHGDLLTQE